MQFKSSEVKLAVQRYAKFWEEKDKSGEQIAFSWTGTQKPCFRGREKAQKVKKPSHTEEKQTCVQL